MHSISPSSVGGVQLKAYPPFQYASTLTAKPERNFIIYSLQCENKAFAFNMKALPQRCHIVKQEIIEMIAPYASALHHLPIFIWRGSLNNTAWSLYIWWPMLPCYWRKAIQVVAKFYPSYTITLCKRWSKWKELPFNIDYSMNKALTNDSELRSFRGLTVHIFELVNNLVLDSTEKC